MIRARWAGVVASACLVWACSGSTSSPVGPVDDAGASADGASADGRVATAYTLDDVCATIPAKICALRKPCCEQTSTYDEAKCIAYEKAQCEKDVADARAGKATFYPERIDPCLVKLEPVFKRDCSLTFDVLYEIVDELRDCNVFDGSLPEGAACERGSQCKHSTAPGELTGCDDDTKKCSTTKLLGENAPCALADGESGFCGKGLYCDADLSKQPASGTCKKATARGEQCDATKRPLSLECGLGNYCEPTTSKCTAGNPGGAACIKAEEYKCASFKCDGASCRASTLVKDVDCKGP
ncbi:MAG: hypothetical protein R3B36_23755 [Polyangiaceae bacterium]